VAGVQVAIREVEVELREQGPDVRERVRELLGGLRGITSFGRCHSVARFDASLLSTGPCCEKDEGKQQRRRHNRLPPDSCALNRRVFFCAHPVLFLSIALPMWDGAAERQPARLASHRECRHRSRLYSSRLSRALLPEMPCFIAVFAMCPKACEGNCRFSAVNSRSRQIL
jgi:hypothetical protein